MKVAVFSDVHANLIALEAFLKETDGVADTYLCLGDVVDYGPWNDECLELVSQLPGITLLEGNHEQLFIGMESLEDELPLVQDFFHISKATFSRDDLIVKLPSCSRLGDFQCLHTLDGRSIYPDTNISIQRNYMIGHSHHQYQINRAGFLIVNPGSVGQNRRWIDMVDYMIFDTSTGGIEMCSVPYDIEMFLSELRSRNYAEQCIAYYANKPRKMT